LARRRGAIPWSLETVRRLGPEREFGGRKNSENRAHICEEE